MNKVKICLWGVIVASSIWLLAGLWLPAKAWLAHQLILDSWQQMLNTKQPYKPWPWADTHAIAKLSFPRLAQERVVLNGADPTSLAFSLGAMHGFADLSQEKPFVVAGHRDSHFQFLQDIQLKDQVLAMNADSTITAYSVADIEIIDSSKKTLALSRDDKQLVLITCYPFDALTGGGPLRFVVTATPSST